MYQDCAQIEHKSEEDFENRKAAQKVIRDSGLDNKELNQIRKKVLAEGFRRSWPRHMLLSWWHVVRGSKSS